MKLTYTFNQLSFDNPSRQTNCRKSLMKNHKIWKRKYVLFLLFGFSGFLLNAQESFPSGGGNINGNMVKVSYTFGQMFYTTFEYDTVSISEGVQQAYEIYQYAATEEYENIKMVYSLYPNPSIGLLYLEVENFTSDNFEYEIYDNNAQLIKREKIVSNETIIDLSANPAGIYFVRLTKNTQDAKIFKIVKTN